VQADWRDNINDTCNYAIRLPSTVGSYLIDTVAKFSVNLNSLQGERFSIRRGYICYTEEEGGEPISALQLGRNYLMVEVRQPFEESIIVKPVFFIGGYRREGEGIVEDKGDDALDTYPIGYQWVTFSKRCWNRGPHPYLVHALDTADSQGYKELMSSCSTESKFPFNPKNDQVNSILLNDAMINISHISIYDPMKMIHIYKKEGADYQIDDNNVIFSNTGAIGMLNRNYWEVTIEGMLGGNHRFFPIDRIRKVPLDVVYYYRDPKGGDDFLRQREQPDEPYIKLERKFWSGNVKYNSMEEGY
jgi:hypothetical protein